MAGVPIDVAAEPVCAKRMSTTGEIHAYRCTEHLRSRRPRIYSFGRNQMPAADAFVRKARRAGPSTEGRPTMDEIVRQAVARAIVTMRNHMDERLTIDDLARAAVFS